MIIILWIRLARRLISIYPFQNGWTPLISACLFGHEKVVEALLGTDPRANIEAVDQVSLWPCFSTQAKPQVRLVSCGLARRIISNCPFFCLEWSDTPYARLS